MTAPIIQPVDALRQDYFGWSIDVSTDGRTAVIGGWGDDVGANANQGSARVFDWDGSAWVQRGDPVTPMDGQADDRFGRAVAISADGNIVAISSGFDNVGSDGLRGSARIFEWSGTAWVQRGNALTPGPGQYGGGFGEAIDLSADGRVAIIGFSGDGATGSARVFAWDGASWQPRGNALAPSGEDIFAFGTSVSINGDGTTAIVGGLGESGALVGQSNARVFAWDGAAWVARGGPLAPTDGLPSEHFGVSVAISLDGMTAVVGSHPSSTLPETAIPQPRVFVWDGSAWIQRGEALLVSDWEDGGFVGTSLAVSANGTTVMVGMTNDVVGSALGQGSARVFDWSGTAWTQRGGTITPADAIPGAAFGHVVALSSDGATAFVGGYGDFTAPDGSVVSDRGSARSFTWNGTQWAEGGPAALPASLSIAALSADKPEGNSGGTAFTFTVTRTGDTSGTASANYALTGAANAADFVGGVLPSGTVTFAAGEAFKTITIMVAGDTVFEASEGFTVTLSSPIGAALGASSAAGTIRNDDAGLLVGTNADETLTGGDGPDTMRGLGGNDQMYGEAGNDTLTGGPGNDILGGGTGSDTYIFNLGDGQDVIIEGQADGGSSDVDVLVFGPGITPGMIAVGLGNAGQDIVIQIGTGGDQITLVGAVADPAARLEAARFADGTTFTFAGLQSVQAMAITAVTPSLLEGDGLNQFELETWGDALYTGFTFIVARSGSVIGPASVDWAVTAASGQSANAEDFPDGILPGGSIHFLAGEAFKTIIVRVRGDFDIEADEAFAVTLSNPSAGVIIGVSTAFSTILNDDLPAISGTTGADTLRGGPGNEKIYGLAGDDLLDGAGGNDELLGGAGDDVLTGGLGLDLFWVDTDTDTITDLGLGGAEVLIVASGATAKATLAAAWVATAETSSYGNATIYTAGFDADVTLAGGSGSWTLSNAGAARGARMIGSAWNDVLIGSGATDFLTGGLRQDILTGGGRVDSFLVDAGTDTVTDLGAGGLDLLNILAGATADVTVAGTWSARRSSSNSGEANIDANGFSVNVGVAQGSSGWNISNQGHATGVTLTGSILGDSLRGGLGNDTLIGIQGLDRFVVDAGTDRILDLGLGGAEVLEVHAGATVNATMGAAWIATAESFNNGIARLTAPGLRVDLREVGGTGGWAVTNAGADRGATFVGSRKDDTLTGGTAVDILTGGLGDDVLTGGLGGDRFVVDGGTDRVTDLGFGGVDQLAVSAGATATVTVVASWTASRASSNDGAANLRTLGFDVDVSQVLGSAGWNITNSGSATGVTLAGSARADVLTGGTGNDTLKGGGGADTLLGGVGNDALTGGLGDDTMTGGLGVDRFVVDAGTDMVTDLASGGADVLIVSAGATAHATLGASWVATIASSNAGTANLSAVGFDVNLALAGGTSGWTVSNAGTARGVILHGSARNDTLIGGDATDLLTGGLGDDVLTGGLGVDRFFVDAGTDRITDLGLGGRDELTVAAGATANVTLATAWQGRVTSSNSGVANLDAAGFDVDVRQAAGGSGWRISNEGHANGVTLIGSAQADVLTAGLGNDTLTGGLGADAFVFSNVASAAGDVITDFNAAQGDMIDLRLIDAGAAAGDQAFGFIGGDAFTPGVAGQLRFAAGLLQGDVDGNGVADFQIQMTGVATLSAANIWL